MNSGTILDSKRSAIAQSTCSLELDVNARCIETKPKEILTDAIQCAGFLKTHSSAANVKRLHDWSLGLVRQLPWYYGVRHRWRLD